MPYIDDEVYPSVRALVQLTYDLFELRKLVHLGILTEDGFGKEFDKKAEKLYDSGVLDR